VAKFPLYIRVLIFGDVLQHFVVSDYFYCLVLIDRHPELDPHRVIFHHGLMIFNEFDNSSSELLAIFLFVHKEGASHKVLRIENRRRWWFRCGLIIRVLASLD
jgi:hypothetical protein